MFKTIVSTRPEAGAFPSIDRARQLNELEQTGRVKTTWLICITVGAATIGYGLMCFAVGMLLHTGTPAAGYDLVQYDGQESDIVDYGLTVNDCAQLLPRMRAAGLQVECETAN
jgi:hypothetical protein